MTQKPSGLNRRRFLQAVGVSGGAGTMFATMGALGLAPAQAAVRRADSFTAPTKSDFNLTGRSSKKVVILGGGVAGLGAAYELGKAGYECTILEARGRTGGRNNTIRGGDTYTDLDGVTQTARFSSDQYMNAGPARLAQWMLTLDYCRELGVPIQVFTNINADAYIYNESAGMTKPMRYREAKADVYGYVSELLSKATNAGALDADLTADDKDRLVEFLADWGQLNKSGKFDGTGSNRGMKSWPTAWDDVGTPLGAPASLSEIFSYGVGDYFSFEFEFDQAMLMFQPVGGMDQIPQALTRAIGAHKVQLGAATTKVEDTVDGVKVTYTQGGKSKQIEADFAIAAMPPHIFRRLEHNLGDDVQNALGKYSALAVGKIGLEYKSRWWETDERIYGGITSTDLDLNVIWYPSYGHHGERGTLIGYYNYGGSYTPFTPKEREEKAVAQGVKIHGEKYRTELAHSFSRAWEKEPFIEGGWTSPPVGTPEYKLLQKPAGPNGQHVYFAGDWLSDMVAWQHGALWSARDTVSALHERVMKG